MSIFSNPIVWPPLSQEIAPFLKYCKGIVLNAGAGQREIKLGQKDLRIDVVSANNPDIVGDLHCIPLLDEAVDTVVSIAVLEHTRYPWVVAQEFYRVLRPNGFGVIAVPFLQPQHACPNDFIRFTENGLVELMKYVGFEVVETAHVHHFGQTLAWLLWEYFQYNKPVKFTWPVWATLINQLSQGKLLKGDSPNTHNTHYVIVRKPVSVLEEKPYYSESMANTNPQTWFFPLLSCPQNKQPLHFSEDSLISEDGQFIYSIKDDIPHLLPGHQSTKQQLSGEL
ncbi:methyltransferase domain-containing protein [Coleofasciculus sp. FACHB-501]|uniref:methyltransferase domain-containing protein n=1 Tax=Cyanophyceae TaxID=3028117 RepID=UPI001684C1FF|nr:methyltransferase domain-containing protein [Coleofasciculus sp. FACHB-501]MBD1837187.1 methyltransferase domain-containing protein [Coleofasciculus sp. FACHB-501]